MYNYKSTILCSLLQRRISRSDGRQGEWVPQRRFSKSDGRQGEWVEEEVYSYTSDPRPWATGYGSISAIRLKSRCAGLIGSVLDLYSAGDRIGDP